MYCTTLCRNSVANILQIKINVVTLVPRQAIKTTTETGKMTELRKPYETKVVERHHGFSSIEVRFNANVGQSAFCLVKTREGTEEIEWLSQDAEPLFFGRSLEGDILFINQNNQKVILPGNLPFFSQTTLYRGMHGKTLNESFSQTEKTLWEIQGTVH